MQYLKLLIRQGESGAEVFVPDFEPVAGLGVGIAGRAEFDGLSRQ
jgi:hypothetical protein